jgi:tetratricopeptide (TPR) repeat protein
MVQSLAYYRQHGTATQLSKACYYLACVESDLSKSEKAEEHFKEAITLATQAEAYALAVKACHRCSLYYQRQANFDEALKMERKAYANQLLLDESRNHSTLLMSSGMLATLLISLMIGAFRRKSQRAHTQLVALQCEHLEEKCRALQASMYELSPVIAKVRRFKERDVPTSGRQPSFTESDWSELLRLQEMLYGFVSKLKTIGPKLTEEDIRVCAFLREGVQPACFAALLQLTPETLTRRISRIKTEKLMLTNGKESLEETVKAL